MHPFHPEETVQERSFCLLAGYSRDPPKLPRSGSRYVKAWQTAQESIWGAAVVKKVCIKRCSWEHFGIRKPHKSIHMGY